MGDAAEFFARQDTALIVRVPEAEHAVSSWRLAHDASAGLGVPARTITGEDLDALRDLSSSFEPFTATLETIEDRGNVIWIRAYPEEPLRALTTAVWERWPEHPPYDGQFDDVVPHLTIADNDLNGIFDPIVESVGPHLPITTRASEIELIAFDDEAWVVREVFRLGTTTEEE